MLTAGSAACSMTVRMTGIAFSASSSVVSKISSSCTCSSMRAWTLAFSSAGSILIIARRMTSAAEPWIGALIEARSLKARTDGLDDLISG